MPTETRTATVSVFRAGPVRPGQHTGDVADLYDRADTLRPTGRSSRSDSIYASPTLLGVTRWVRGNALIHADHTVTEIRTTTDDAYVYSIEAWENATFRSTITNDRLANYWTTGIPLSDWATAAADHNLDPRQWEVLLPATNVLTTRPVTSKRLVTSIPDSDHTRRDLMWTLERRKASKGLYW